MPWDFFISHATEDKADVARPLADMLRAANFNVWYDEYTLTLGDNLRHSIEQGLANSRFGIVILSPSFFAKKWTQLELDGLFALERPGEKRILPIWHNVSAADVERFSSFLAMRLGVATNTGLDHVVQKIIEAVRREEMAAELPHDPLPLSHLHPHSIEILQAAQEADGAITMIRHIAGFRVEAGGNILGDESDPRTEALNLHCIDELIANGLVEQQGPHLLALTQEGFDFLVPAGVLEAPRPRLPRLTTANYEHAKELMKAAVAGSGRILSIPHMGGFALQADQWTKDSGGDRRIEARWKSVLNELLQSGLLLQLSDEVFLVSHLGFLWTDAVDAQQ